MSQDRYIHINVLTGLSGDYLSSFPAINPKDLERSDDIFIKLKYGQRLDNIAYQFWGDGSLWWVICLVNGFKTPFDSEISTGKLIRVPHSINHVLATIDSKSQ
jgi:hypothetical protein